jgi:hypothetical protein
MAHLDQTRTVIQALWDAIHEIDEQLAPYHAAWDLADDALREGLADGLCGYSLLELYDARMLRRHADYPVVKPLIEERKYLLGKLPPRKLGWGV